MTAPNTFTGRTIGHYEVVRLLGKGGMGEVYLARDSRLARDVAVKILPEFLAAVPDRLRRFDQEAQALAAVNHPNIAAIYGLEHFEGGAALVLELVDGESLEHRLRKGAIDVRTALEIARQIADALDAAHEKGIIHRDLKPANVMLQAGRGPRAKVLDFGLAKRERPSGLADTAAPTAVATEEGVILGTVAYMSPEQARGQAVDKRTDVWAFGCVLYEMLTGRRAFCGTTTSDVLAAILTAPPDWNVLADSVSPSLLRLVQRLLERDAALRPRDIGDVRSELDREILSIGPIPASHVAPADRSGRTSRRLVWSAIVVTLAALVVAAVIAIGHGRTVSSSVPDTPVQLTDFYDAAVAPSLSPDGKWVTFLRGPAVSFGASAPRGDVFVKMLNGDDPPLQLTHDGNGKEQPIFTPDGARIVYTAAIGSFRWDSYEVAMLGQGAPQSFRTNTSGLQWLPDGNLLYSEIIEGVHMKLATSTDAGAAHRDIYVPKGDLGMAHRSYLSPDRRSLLVVEMDGSGWLPCRLLPFDGSSIGKRVGPTDGQCVTAAWSPDGKWMYFTSNAGGSFHVWRQLFPAGKPEQVTFPPDEQEGTTPTQDGRFLVTSQGHEQAAIWLHDQQGERQLTSEGFAMLPTRPAAGDLVYYLMRAGPQKTFVSGELWSVSLANGEKRRVLPGVIMTGYSITPDARRVVYTSYGASGGDGVCVADLAQEGRLVTRQLTHGGEDRAFAVGDHEIIYTTAGDVAYVYRMKEDGSGSTRIAGPVLYMLNASPDGRWVAATVPTAAKVDGGKLLIFPTDGGAPYTACESCAIGFGPLRAQSPVIQWSSDNKTVALGLRIFRPQAQRTALLPYDSHRALESLWPKGLETETAVLDNPGVQVVNEPNAFAVPGTGSYLLFRLTTQANLWKIPLPR